MSNSDPLGAAATVEPGPEPEPGQPRSARDAEFLERFDKRMRLPIIISAILPLVVVPESGGWVGVAVGVVTWLVFLVDYVVHVRHLVRFRRTRFGRFDLIVVVATAPWFLLPGLQAGRFVVALRLARLARVAMASKASRRLFETLGYVALVAAGVTAIGSLIAFYAERPTNPEFATFGDSIWWGIVTLTTVGYGDIVPKTPAGRWAGVMIMLTGIAVLGLLSGSLASFFRLDRGAQGSAPSTDDDDLGQADAEEEASRTTAITGDPVLQALTAEVSALRRQLEVLTERVTAALPDRPSGHGPPT